MLEARRDPAPWPAEAPQCESFRLAALRELAALAGSIDLVGLGIAADNLDRSGRDSSAVRDAAAALGMARGILAGSLGPDSLRRPPRC